MNHSSSAKPSILQLSYSFDAIKNELKSRTTGGDFNIIESFDYDDNNRLVNWSYPISGFKPAQNRNVYDVKGRILEHEQIGSIKFENTQKIYQPTSMVLNAVGTRSYYDDLIQSISYNENNDPVLIDGEKGDVAFQYGLTSMRQRATYGGNFSANGEGKFTKFYSEDGSFEVIKDNTTGREKHVLYIEGTPYESNIVYLKDYTQSSGSFRFLHKDYLGSILSISDEAGNKLQQRHFDAWGNFTHLKVGNEVTTTNPSIILNASTDLIVDRGYTSHEHFGEVKIIHMNGRLYDPFLRRFLNADENIQSPFNTQNYNKYGYVLNNPLMYNDPSGEFFWIALGAVAGAYFTGVKANGSWNPTQWNWSATWGKIVMGGAVGAFTGGVGASLGASALTASATLGIKGGILGGAISGATGGAVAGAINGFASAVMFGEDALKGTLMGGLSGAAMGGVLGGVFGGGQQILKNASGVGPKGTILKGASIAEGRSAWTLNNTPKTTTVGVSSKVSSSGKIFKLNVEKTSGEFEVGRSIVDEQAGAAIYRADKNLATVNQPNIVSQKVAKGGIEAVNGIKITGFTSHGVNRAIGSFGRSGVKPNAILDAIKNPLKINNAVTDQLGRQSQRFIGQFGEVVVNPQTGKIISVNPTSSSKAAKLLKQLGQ